MDTTTKFLFGRSINSLSPDGTEQSKRFSWAFDHALGCIAQKIRFGKFNFLSYGPRYSEACKYIHDHVQLNIQLNIHYAVEYRKSKGNIDTRAAMMEFYQERAKKADPEKRAQRLKEVARGDLDEKPVGDDQDERYVFLYDTVNCRLSTMALSRPRQY